LKVRFFDPIATFFLFNLTSVSLILQSGEFEGTRKPIFPLNKWIRSNNIEEHVFDRVIRAIDDFEEKKKERKLNRDWRTREIFKSSSCRPRESPPRFFDDYYRKMQEGSGQRNVDVGRGSTYMCHQEIRRREDPFNRGVLQYNRTKCTMTSAGWLALWSRTACSHGSAMPMGIVT